MAILADAEPEDRTPIDPADVVARMREFVAADPAEFAETGNRVRAQRIAGGAPAGRMAPLTAEIVARAQRTVARMLAEHSAQVPS